VSPVIARRLADKDDACPEEAGTSEGNGCPEIKKEALNEMNSIGSDILFPANGFKLMGKKTLNALQEIKRILDENPLASILIEGHASTDGSEKSNLDLSLRRAESVKSKLIELGIGESRIKVNALGETMPIVGEDSIETRSKSRRVVFKSNSSN
jgi:outer membrane protein OmpA-like peptidoglycan-associated protein